MTPPRAFLQGSFRVIDLTKPYNWLAIVFVMVLGGFILRQIGNRVPLVRQINVASGQAA